MPAVRFIPNMRGFRELLTSAGVAADLERRANAVKSSAEESDVTVGGSKHEPMPYVVGTTRTPGRTALPRARARVVADHPAGLAVEAKYRTLGRAIDAAR